MLFALIAIYNLNSLTLSNGNVITTKGRQASSDVGNSWYFMKLKNYSISNISNLLDVEIKTTDYLSPRWITVYLTEEQAHTVEENKLGKLIPVKSTDKVDKNFKFEYNKTKQYLVHASKHFKGHKKLAENYFVVTTDNVYDLLDNPDVLQVTEAPMIELNNRWIHGFIQSNKNEISFNKYAEGLRTLDLDGNNTIVTILDSGVNSNNLFFKDDNYEFPINKTNMNHRKIIRYNAVADAIDRNVGHGTHVAGIIGGYSKYDGMNLYKGGAYNSKLFVVDIVPDSTDAAFSLPFEAVYDSAKESIALKSHIVSCSWGAVEENRQITNAVNLLVYSFDSLLYVIAAGNTGKVRNVFTPANSKNVLTVGSAKSPQTSSTETSQDTYIYVDGENIDCSSRNLFSFMKDLKNLKSYENVEYKLINRTEDFSQSVALITDRSSYYDDFSGLAIITNVSSINSIKCPSVSVSSEVMDKLLHKENKTLSLRFNISKNNYDKHIYSSRFNSFGPTRSGLVKPDICGFGESILSAGTTGEFSIVSKTGTSMAAPSISAALALVEQYITEKRHGLDIEPFYSNSLLRAFIVQSASRKTPFVDCGYGIPRLDKVLITEKDFGKRGIRFFNHTIKQNQHLVFNVSVNPGDFDITMAWTDPALQSLADNVPEFFMDLDLMVVTPDGQKIYGNHGADTEAYSTIEKVSVNNTKKGDIEVHILTSKFLTDELSEVKFSLVYNGEFNNTDVETNPIHPKINKLEMPKCDKLTTSPLCNNVINVLDKGNTKVQQIQGRTYRYFAVNTSNTNRKYAVVSFHLYSFTTPGDMPNTKVSYFSEHSYKMNHPTELFFMTQETKSSFAFKINHKQDLVYLSFFFNQIGNATMNVNVSFRSSSGEFDFMEWITIPSFKLPENYKILLAAAVLSLIACGTVYAIVSKFYPAPRETITAEIRVNQNPRNDDIQIEV